MTLASRVKGLFGGRQARGSSVADVPASYPTGWWQQGMSLPNNSGSSSIVQACVSRYAQTIAQLPFEHKRRNEDGGWSVVKGSTATRLLRKPNSRQTSYNLFHALVSDLLCDGNGYLAGLGADAGRKNFTELVVLGPGETVPHEVVIEGEGVEVVYSVGGRSLDFAKAVEEGDLSETTVLHSENVAHIRQQTGLDRLKGVPPIAYAKAAESANLAITASQAAFFGNMSRPSGALRTEKMLTADQVDQLRAAWETKTTGANVGRVPVLNGVTWETMSMTSQDAQMVDAWRMSVEEVSRVYLVPLPLVNSMDGATFDNVDNLLRHWLATGLGSMIRLIELDLQALFGIPPGEKIAADVSELVRMDRLARMQALGEGVRQGILSPNEARLEEGFGAVTGGASPRVQQQMVPLDVPQEAPAPDVIDEAELSALVDEELAA